MLMNKMPSNSLYKEPRTCVCGYVTLNSSAWCTHKKCCKSIQQVKEQETNDRWRSYDKTLQQLTEQLSTKDEQVADQLQTKDDELKAMAEQLRAKDEQLRAKDEQILNLTNQLLQQANKRLNANETQKTAKRKKLSEPERRKIAIRQEWNCANPDGKCRLKGKLQEYDIDHIKPLCQGGQDEPSNFQAICPACHRRKTERDLGPGAAAEPAEVD